MRENHNHAGLLSAPPHYPRTQDNVFGLSDEELKQREVVHMDIAHTHVGNPPDMPEAGKEQPASPGVPKTTPGDGNLVPVGDPRGVRSAKTGRGPLREKGWEKQAAPVMCAYKLVRMTCDVPFHSKIERAVLKSAIHDLVLNAHKNIFCSLDEWAWLDVETIRDFEKRAFAAAASAIEGDMCPAEKLDLPESPCPDARLGAGRCLLQRSSRCTRRKLFRLRRSSASRACRQQ